MIWTISGSNTIVLNQREHLFLNKGIINYDVIMLSLCCFCWPYKHQSFQATSAIGGKWLQKYEKKWTFLIDSKFRGDLMFCKE